MVRLLSMRGRLNQLNYLVLLVAIGIAVGIFIVRPRSEESQISNARVVVQNIRSAVCAWQVIHGDSTCPTLRQLVAGKHLAFDTRMVDPWEQPFVITCRDSTASVTSLGPDRGRGTPDDIVALPVSCKQ